MVCVCVCYVGWCVRLYLYASMCVVVMDRNLNLRGKDWNH